MQGSTNILKIDIEGIDGDNISSNPFVAELDQTLNQTTTKTQSLTDYSTPLGYNGEYTFTINSVELADFHAGQLSLVISQESRSTPITLTIPPPPVSYSPMGPAVTMKQTYPSVESLGFVGSSVAALRFGYDMNPAPAKVIRRFSWTGNQLMDNTPSGYFATTAFLPKSRAAMSMKNVYLLRDATGTGGTGLEFRSCAIDAATGGLCTIFNTPQLALTTQGLAVSQNDMVAVVASADGTLSWAQIGNSQAMLMWQSLPVVPQQPSGASVAVKVGVGDVNGDGVSDVVAAWQGTSGPVWGILTGKSSGGGDSGLTGFSVDSSSLSMTLTSQGNMAASTGVDALAVGDLQQDGVADVVVGSGWKVTVLSNNTVPSNSQEGSFTSEWSTTLTPTPPGMHVTAIAMGMLDSIGSAKSLDLVVGSDGLPDPMGTGMGTLYLQAFRAP